MQNQKKLAKITSPLVWQKQGNEIIERLNIGWEVKVKPDNAVKVATVTFGDNKITIDLEFNTIDVVACDENGEQKTYTIIGFDAATE